MIKTDRQNVNYEICAVIDTNVFLGIFRYPDNVKNNRFWQHIVSGEIVPIYSLATLSENYNKLIEHSVPDDLVDEFITTMVENGIYMEDLIKMRVLMKDFKDLPFYEVSLAANKITGTDILLATHNVVDFKEYRTKETLPKIEIKTEQEICAALEEAIKFARRTGVENHDNLRLLLDAADKINEHDINELLCDEMGYLKREALLTQEGYECYCIQKFFSANIDGFEFAVSAEDSMVIRQVILDQKKTESDNSKNDLDVGTQQRIRHNIESLLSSPDVSENEDIFLAFSDRLKAICHIMGGDLSDYIDDIGNKFFGVTVMLPTSAEAGANNKARKASFVVDCEIAEECGKWLISVPYRFVSSDYRNGTINITLPSYKEIRLIGAEDKNNNESIRMTFKQFSDCIVKVIFNENHDENSDPYVNPNQEDDVSDSDDFWGLGE